MRESSRFYVATTVSSFSSCCAALYRPFLRRVAVQLAYRGFARKTLGRTDVCSSVARVGASWTTRFTRLPHRQLQQLRSASVASQLPPPTP